MIPSGVFDIHFFSGDFVFETPPAPHVSLSFIDDLRRCSSPWALAYPQVTNLLKVTWPSDLRMYQIDTQGWAGLLGARLADAMDV